jgi:hypothetical protein
MKIDIKELLPPGRPKIYLDSLFVRRDHPHEGRNLCVCASLADPQGESLSSLVKGLRKILPFIYHTFEQAVSIFVRYGLDPSKGVPLPPSFEFQWAHTGEILICAYFEEIENAVVLSYKWRLNTTKNQHQYGMDLLAFNLNQNPPVIYAIAVKTTNQGHDGKTPSVVYEAIYELRDYLASEKLDDDLGIIDANLHTSEDLKKTFKDWYDPYSQGSPKHKPIFVPVPAIVIDEKNWNDKYAYPSINYNFGILGAVRIICINGLEDLVKAAYSGA